MAESNSLVWILSVMVLGALCGPVIAVMSATDHNVTVVDDGPGKQMALETKDALPSWTLFSDMPNSIGVDCQSQVTALGETVLLPQTSLSQEFPILPNFQELWVCDFKWSTPAGSPFNQSFEVWGHDGRTSYLQKCSECEWRIGQGGFYYKDTDGQYHHQWDWVHGALSH